jgi:uncharacterized protein (TIGR00106 family)
MLFSLTMFPVGAGRSVCAPVAEVIDEIDRAGLPYHVTGMETVIEGDWNDVMPLVERAEQKMRAKYGRVFMALRIDDRAGADRLHASVADVERALGRPLGHDGNRAPQPALVDGDLVDD